MVKHPTLVRDKNNLTIHNFMNRQIQTSMERYYIGSTDMYMTCYKRVKYVKAPAVI